MERMTKLNSSCGDTADKPGSETVPTPLSQSLKLASRHETFWYYDGSIVLLVEDMLFRVHQTVLSNSSEMFATLFSLPQPVDSDDQESVEGCAVVQLYDRQEDFVDLLKALYHPSHLDDLPAEPALNEILDSISGILRLSTKYTIPSLRRKCISILTNCIPTTLEDHDNRAARNAKRHKSSDIMRAIRLAKETDVLVILPYAFYCVSRLSPLRILKDSPDDITWQEKTICLIGRERLRYAEMSLSHSFLLAFQPAPICAFRLCAIARGPHTEWHILEADRCPNPLKRFTRWESLNVCPVCVAYAKRQHEAGRKEVWDCLPAVFEMDSWDKLRESTV